MRSVHAAESAQLTSSLAAAQSAQAAAEGRAAAAEAALAASEAAHREAQQRVATTEAARVAAERKLVESEARVVAAEGRAAAAEAARSAAEAQLVVLAEARQTTHRESELQEATSAEQVQRLEKEVGGRHAVSVPGAPFAVCYLDLVACLPAGRPSLRAGRCSGAGAQRREPAAGAGREDSRGGCLFGHHRCMFALFM